MHAGVDWDMQSSCYLNFTASLIGKNILDKKNLDDAVRRILLTKMKMGLFENPYKFCNKQRESHEIMKPSYLSFARKFAANSCVLLKNKNHLLPLSKNVKTIALIGPLSDSKMDMLGCWSAAGDWQKCITLYQGIHEKFGESVKIVKVSGCQINGISKSDFPQAIAAAKTSDVVILALGENREMSSRAAASRTSINITGVQLDLVKEICNVNPNCVVVLFNGRPLVLTELDKVAPSILETWFGGTQAGNAIADVLWGDVNPSGKLTMTFPRNIGQIPIYYNAKNTGRPIDPKNPDYKYASRYIDCPNSPLYPFGYGLSYTSFQYSNIQLNHNRIFEKDSIVASIEISNTGFFDGTEIVQLYTHQLVGEITRPVKELKGFKRIFIPKGQSRKVSFTIHPKDLAYYHKDQSIIFDPGDYELFIGNSSIDDRKANFCIVTNQNKK